MAQPFKERRGVHYEYDKNRISRLQLNGAFEENTADSVNAQYEFYADGKLKSVSYPAFADGTVPISEYTYDEAGRLTVEAEILALTIDGETEHVALPAAHYIWGPDRVLAKLDELTGNSYYYLYNGHGDVVQIVDTNGNVVNTYDYDVWGNFITKDGTIHNPFTYFCQTYDETTGLYYH